MNFEGSLVKAQNAFTASDYQSAEGYYLQALNEAILAHGHNDSAVIIACLNYADFLSQLDRYDEARPMIRRACEVATNLHQTSLIATDDSRSVASPPDPHSRILSAIRTEFQPDVDNTLMDR